VDGTPDGGRRRTAARPADPVRVSLPDPRTGYRVLAVMCLAAAGFAALFTLVTTAADSLHDVDAVVAVLLTVLAVFELTVAPRLPDGLGLDLCILVGIGMAAIGMLRVHSGEGQMLVCLGLLGLGVFTAYFRPRARLVVHLTLACVVVVGGAALNRVLSDSPLDLVMALVVLVGVSVMVSTLVERLREVALRDSLTGLLNRGGLELVAAPLGASAHRTGRPVTVAMIDLDAFKAFNDTHGHLAGDQLLVDAATAWSGAIRTGDVLGRFGGDEFVVVLPDTDLTQADELLARLRESVLDVRWTAGTALWAASENFYAAIDCADRALLESKRIRIPDQTTGGSGPAPEASTSDAVPDQQSRSADGVGAARTSPDRPTRQ